MPRPKKCRKIGFYPDNTIFTPEKAFTSEIILTFEEIESLRLCDLKEMDQSEAADSMDVSRGTLQRILNTARKKVADAITNGKLIKIANCECGENKCSCHNQNNAKTKNHHNHESTCGGHKHEDANANKSSRCHVHDGEPSKHKSDHNGKNECGCHSSKE